MGAITKYVCEKCGFSISDRDLNYFVDEETNCVVEHASGMLTFDMGYGSKIRGKIILSFCPDCSSEVHFYYNENESYVKEIKTALEQDEEDFKEVLDEKYPYRTISSVLKDAIGSKDKTHSECPKCGKHIPLITENECECPKCSGKLYGLMVALYD
ncbi:hypothetical protein [Methanobrevibacter sp.]|uniref:hypothetical protein n=1 Tax=Methanobrevibacter sp. TaxID=66852 RepID=UPI00386AB7DD